MNIPSQPSVSFGHAHAPGPGLGALLRSLPDLRRDPLAFIQQAVDAYGDIVQFRLGWLNAFLINSPEGIRRVLQDNHHSYSKNTIQYNALAAVTGKGLLTSDGEPWLVHRRLMQPAFSRPRVQGFGPLMIAATRHLLREWEAAAASGQPVDVDQDMMRLALEILGQALLGVDLRRDAPGLTAAVVTVLDHIVEGVKSPLRAPAFFPTAANRRFRSALKTLDLAVGEIIAAHQGERNPSQDDLLSLMIRAGVGGEHPAMDARQLRDEMITILIAGHETVASALTWACYLLSQNPPVAEKMQAELCRVLGGREPVTADLPALGYTSRVFDEALRLHPPAWLITRKCIRPDRIAGYSIPAGSLVVIGVAAMQRHPAYWPEPERFEPDRFTPEQSGGRPRFAYLPFGGGPRLCIGNSFALTEAPLILASIFQRFRLEMTPGTIVEPVALVTQRPRFGLPMVVSKV